MMMKNIHLILAVTTIIGFCTAVQAGGDEDSPFWGYSDIGPDAYKKFNDLVTEDMPGMLARLKKVMATTKTSLEANDTNWMTVCNAMSEQFKSRVALAQKYANNHLKKKKGSPLPDDWAKWCRANRMMLAYVQLDGLKAISHKRKVSAEFQRIVGLSANDKMRMDKVKRNFDLVHKNVSMVWAWSESDTKMDKDKVKQLENLFKGTYKALLVNAVEILKDMKKEADTFFADSKMKPDKVKEEFTKIYDGWKKRNQNNKLYMPAFTKAVKDVWAPKAEKIATNYKHQYGNYEKACKVFRDKEILADYEYFDKDGTYDDVPKVADGCVDVLQGEK
jgi:hypothetical protein